MMVGESDMGGGLAVTLGAGTVGDDVGSSMRQGGGLSLHDRSSRFFIEPVQHDSLPPGRKEQPVPPQAPHDDAQHTVPLRIPVIHIGSFARIVGESDMGGGLAVVGARTVGDDVASAMRQGGGLSLHNRSSRFFIEPVQHDSLPPGREEQPVPPQAPHDDSQQTVPLRIPVKQ